MANAPRDPESGERFLTPEQMDRVASRWADMALASGSVEVPEPPSPEAPDPRSVAGMQTRISKITEQLTTNARDEDAAAMAEREDPQASLGGGINTYRQLGRLPVDEHLPITEHSVRGRDGRLFREVRQGDRYKRVEVIEGQPLGPKIDKAKEELRRGGGRLRQTRAKRQ